MGYAQFLILTEIGHLKIILCSKNPSKIEEKNI